MNRVQKIVRDALGAWGTSQESRPLQTSATVHPGPSVTSTPSATFLGPRHHINHRCPAGYAWNGQRCVLAAR